MRNTATQWPCMLLCSFIFTEWLFVRDPEECLFHTLPKASSLGCMVSRQCFLSLHFCICLPPMTLSCQSFMILSSTVEDTKGSSSSHWSFIANCVTVRLYGTISRDHRLSHSPSSESTKPNTLTCHCLPTCANCENTKT